MWWQCAVPLEGQHLASTPMDTNESACIMGVTLLRVFALLQGGGFLTAHHWLFFVYFLQFLFSLLNNPLFALPTLFRHSRILSANWHSTSSTPPKPPSAYWQSIPAPIALFVKVSLGRACNDYNLNFSVDVKWQISQQPSLFPKLLLCHWQITPLSFWKHPVVIVETFKVKV